MNSGRTAGRSDERTVATEGRNPQSDSTASRSGWCSGGANAYNGRTFRLTVGSIGSLRYE